jgi:hypothetical protein
VAPNFAGRPLRISTDRYVIFAHSRDLAEELAEWVDREFVAFQSAYQVSPKVVVAIASIEQGEGLAPVVKEWRRQNVSRVRPVEFEGTGRPVVFKQGRPYCQGRWVPNFTESFVMPTGAALQLGLVEKGTVKAPTIAFLTTDQHWEEAFQLSEWVFDRTAIPGPEPRILRRLVDSWSAREAHTLDLKLMHLQRREVLWKSLIEASFSDRGTIDRLRHELIVQTDREFGKIYLSRRKD